MVRCSCKGLIEFLGKFLWGDEEQLKARRDGGERGEAWKMERNREKMTMVDMEILALMD